MKFDLIIVHFIRDLEIPRQWIMSYGNYPLTFNPSKNNFSDHTLSEYIERLILDHRLNAYEIKSKGSSYSCIGITFETDTDEAEFILKYQNGVEMYIP